MKFVFLVTSMVAIHASLQIYVKPRSRIHHSGIYCQCHGKSAMFNTGKKWQTLHIFTQACSLLAYHSIIGRNNKTYMKVSQNIVYYQQNVMLTLSTEVPKGLPREIGPRYFQDEYEVIFLNSLMRMQFDQNIKECHDDVQKMS